MSTATTPRITSSTGSVATERQAPRAEARTPAHRYRQLFAVPFRSPMGDGDSNRLARALGMAMSFRPKTQPTPTSPGMVRLDFFSGLFLVRGPTDGEWQLEGRTWGTPAGETVHGWHLQAAAAARQLDPSVPVPAPDEA